MKLTRILSVITPIRHFHYSTDWATQRTSQVVQSRLTENARLGDASILLQWRSPQNFDNDVLK